MAVHQALFDVLARFSDTLTDRFDVADVLYGVSDNTVTVLDATAAGVSLAGDDGELRFVSANSQSASEVERAQQEFGQGPCHQAVTSGEVVVVDDLTERDDWPKYRARAKEVGFRAVIGMPLTAGGRQLGALNIYHDRRREWSVDNIEAARILANIATSYVLHASHLDEAQRLNEQLREALESRIVIEQAKGLLAGESGVSLDTAFTALRNHARNRQVSLRSVADAVVELGLRPNTEK